MLCVQADFLWHEENIFIRSMAPKLHCLALSMDLYSTPLDLHFMS